MTCPHKRQGSKLSKRHLYKLLRSIPRSIPFSGNHHIRDLLETTLPPPKPYLYIPKINIDNSRLYWAQNIGFHMLSSYNITYNVVNFDETWNEYIRMWMSSQ